MLIKFYREPNSLKVWGDFLDAKGSSARQALSTHEITDDIIEVLSRVMWFDDLPLTVPVNKLYGVMSAVGINLQQLIPNNNFWSFFSDLLGDPIPSAAYRKS